MLKLGVVAVLMALAVGPSSLHAQEFSITGIVIERSGGTPVRGATIRLSGSPDHITGNDGRFAYTRVSPGRYTLSVEALGYRSRSFEIDLRADTALTIQLERAPVAIDSVVARAENVTIRGSIRDRETGTNILQASVVVYPGGRTIGAISGDFTIRNVHKGDSVTLAVEAAEHLPRQITLVAESDTTFDIMLDVDSVALRMIKEQVKRLNTRSLGVPYAIKTVGRDELRITNPTNIGDVLRAKLMPAYVPDDTTSLFARCIFLDDRRIEAFLILHMQPEIVERVEIYGQDARMIRVYTKRYVASLARRPRLDRIVFMPIGVKPVCQ